MFLKEMGTAFERTKNRTPAVHIRKEMQSGRQSGRKVDGKVDAKWTQING